MVFYDSMWRDLRAVTRWSCAAALVFFFATAIAFPADSSTQASAPGSTRPSESSGASAFKPISFSVTRAQARTVAMEWLNRSGERKPTVFGISLDAETLQAPPDRPLVILVHGYNSAPERLAAFQTTIRQAGYPFGTLRYPSDQPIADSGALLSAELRRLAKEQPGRKIVLLTHSMGGLVVRDAIENPSLDHGNVSQLIMIAPPSHGTMCAYLACGANLWVHIARSQRHNLSDALYASLENGLGEARRDMQPNSEFLQQLNERPRNPDVRYTVFLGTGTIYSTQQLVHFRQLVRQCAQADSFIALVEPALQRVLSDLDDSVAVGDGCVSLARGRLDGVADTVLLGFNHWNVIEQPEPEAVAQLHREILNRLADGAASRVPSSTP